MALIIKITTRNNFELYSSVLSDIEQLPKILSDIKKICKNKPLKKEKFNNMIIPVPILSSIINHYLKLPNNNSLENVKYLTTSQIATLLTPHIASTDIVNHKISLKMLGTILQKNNFKRKTIRLNNKPVKAYSVVLI